MDLCEEDDKNIRINALKGLPKICQAYPGNVSQIAVILTQLLNEEDPVEVQVVKQGLDELMEISLKDTLIALLQQIANPTTVEETKQGEALREKAIDYLSDILKRKRYKIQPQLQVKETEEEVIKEMEKVLHLFSSPSENFTNKEKEAENMRLFLGILSRFKTFEEDGGKWLALLKTHCPVDLNKPLDLGSNDDKWKLRKFIGFLRVAKRAMKSQQDNSQFFPYLMQNVFPLLSTLKTTNADDEKLRVDSLKTISEVSQFTSENLSRMFIGPIYNSLKSELSETNLNFTNIECFLFTFHQLAQKAKGSLNELCGIKIITGQPTDTYGDFKHLREQMIKMLTSLETTISPFLEKLRLVIKKLYEEGKDKNRDQIRSYNQTCNCLDNILVMARALKKYKPDFLTYAQCQPSWIISRKKEKRKTLGKRKQSDDNKEQQGKQKQRKQTKQEQKKQTSNRNQGRRGRGGKRI